MAESFVYPAAARMPPKSTAEALTLAVTVPKPVTPSADKPRYLGCYIGV